MEREIIHQFSKPITNARLDTKSRVKAETQEIHAGAGEEGERALQGRRDEYGDY
jgi:hypothetical protein